MKNFLFISCNFPRSYFHFTEALKNVGFNVIGLGDTPYFELEPRLLSSLSEYYYLPNLMDTKRVEQAVEELISRHGVIDFIESNNEFWLGLDAHLRSKFHVTTGKGEDEIEMYKSKSLEKEYFKKAGAKFARYTVLSSFEKAKEFAQIVSYPLIIKPDSGVGGHSTYRINNEEELKEFFHINVVQEKYLIEEFINGELVTFDGITSKDGNVIYCSSEVFPDHFDCVNDHDVDIYYYGSNNVPSDLREIGTSILKTMDAKYRYFHIEFLRMSEDKEGLGKKGDPLVMEANMRAPGGYTVEVINYATSISSYEVYARAMADLIKEEIIPLHRQFSAYIGRRKNSHYVHSVDDIKNKYFPNVLFHQEVPKGLEDVLGDDALIARFEKEEDVYEFFAYTTKKA